MRRRHSKSRPLILVTDGWLANAGDAAIQLAMRRSLQRRIPGARVAVSCHHRELVGDRYPMLKLAPPLDALVGLRWPWTSDADVAAVEDADALVEAADLVLVPGGGFLEEHYGPEGRIRIYEHLLERGKRVMFYAQTIGRFRDDTLRRRLTRVLERAELVLVRDRPSRQRVEELGVRSQLTADEAFTIRAPRRGLRRKHSILVTVSLHPWATGDGVHIPAAQHMELVAASLTRALQHGFVSSVTLASTAQGLGGPRWALEDDALASDMVRAHVPSRWRDRVSVHSGYVSATEYVALARRHAAVVSMRMHGAILGAVAGASVLLANGSLKARELSERTHGAIRTIEAPEELGELDPILAPMLTDAQAWRRPQRRGLAAMAGFATANSELVARRLAAGA